MLTISRSTIRVGDDQPLLARRNGGSPAATISLVQDLVEGALGEEGRHVERRLLLARAG